MTWLKNMFSDPVTHVNPPPTIGPPAGYLLPKVNIYSRIEFVPLTEREHKLAREMARAIWDIDLDEVEQLSTKRDGMVIPFWPPERKSLRWREEWEMFERRVTPEFESVTIMLDRWLVPWKVKAGYSKRINTLVFQVKEIT